NREGRDESHSKTNSVHDALNDLQNIGGIDDGNSRKLLKDAHLNGSNLLWFDAQRTIIDSRKVIKHTKKQDELIVDSHAKRVRPANIRDAGADISSKRSPFDHTSDFQTERLGSKLLHRHKRLSWLRRPPSPVEKLCRRRNVLRP